MTEHALRDDILGFSVAPCAREPWKFLAIEPLMKEPRQKTLFTRQLKIANSLFFKVWMLVWQLQILSGVLALALLVLLGYAAYVWWNSALFTLRVKGVVAVVAALALSLLGLGVVAKLVNYRKTATEILIGVGMATFGFLLARLHLHVFDKLFLWHGHLQRLLAGR
jgi:hypothetical protein